MGCTGPLLRGVGSRETGPPGTEGSEDPHRKDVWPGRRGAPAFPQWDQVDGTRVPPRPAGPKSEGAPLRKACPWARLAVLLV